MVSSMHLVSVLLLLLALGTRGQQQATSGNSTNSSVVSDEFKPSSSPAATPVSPASPATTATTTTATTTTPAPATIAPQQANPVILPEPMEAPPPPEDENVYCGSALTGSSGRFTSSHFPDNYDSRSNCTWNITVDEGKRVKLSFHLFNIEENPNCMWDYVKVFDSNGTLLKFICGYLQQDLVLVSTKNTISVHFFSDNVIEAAGFLASWEAVDNDVAVVGGNSTVGKEGYLLTFPQSFTTSAESFAENVCLQMFNVAEDGVVHVRIFGNKNLISGPASVEVDFKHAAGDKGVHCQQVRMPQDFDSAAAVVQVEAKFASGYSILSYKSIRALKLAPMVLVQTDKSDYRPKQSVRFRVLALNYELKPSKSVKSLKEVWVTDPQDSRLAQWSSVELKKGVAQREFLLPEEPTLGTWTIHVRHVNGSDGETLAKFTVSENVLPKFEVTTEAASKVILVDSEGETFKVCGRYTHGGKVKGVANVTIYVEFKENYWRAPRKRVGVHKPQVALSPTDGCAQVRLNGTEIAALYKHSSTIPQEDREFPDPHPVPITFTELRFSEPQQPISPSRLTFRPPAPEPETAEARPIHVLAVITEEVTGTRHNTTGKYEVHNTPFVIDAGSSAGEHIVGGFPYVGKVRVSGHDGSPLAGVNLEVCARLFTSIDLIRDFVTSNSHRFYSYTEDEFLALADRLTTLKHAQLCQQHRTKEDGTLSFSVPLYDLSTNVTKLSVKFTALDNPANETSGMLRPETTLDVPLTPAAAGNETSSAALTIFTEDKPRLRCEGNKVRVFFAAAPGSKVELSYYVSSGGAILAHGNDEVAVGTQDLEQQFVGDAVVIDLKQGSKKAGTIVSSHDIELKRPFSDEGKVAKTIKVLVYIHDDSNKASGSAGLSTTREFAADNCGPQPTVKFSVEKLSPGDSAKLVIQGESEAFCGYSVVDKSVDLVPNENKITVPRVQELKEAVMATRIVGDKTTEQCRNANLLFQAFERLGLFVMSDRLVIDTKCDKLVDVTSQKREDPEPLALQEDSLALGGGAPVAFSAERPAMASFAAPPPPAGFGGANKLAFASPAISFGAVAAKEEIDGEGRTVSKNKIDLRNYFPETWLFDMIDLDASGQASVEIKAPHTITTWVAELFCSHPDAGLGVANATSLVVTQDFFADINLPYSVKRGELLPVNVSVFNSVADRRLPMRLTLRDSDAYKVQQEQSTSDVCLKASDSEIKTFVIKATELHEVNVTVEAKITATADPSSACDAAGKAEGYTDVQQKSIQVKPEGFPVEKVQSVFQCRSSSSPASNQEEAVVHLEALSLPDNVVNGSDRAWVMVSGDIMAPALANLDRLVTQPTGCGEQNMITMAPNVYLMEYLNGTGKKEPELEAKAKKNMATGFQQEQKFRHANGAYSVWGPEQDKVGSMWLTAFVLRVFSQATRFIHIDPQNMQGSVDFVLENQLKKSGCFNATGFVIHSDLAGTGQSITASVLLTLLEIKQNKVDIRVEDQVFEDALKCIVGNVTKDTDVYTKAVTAYALSLYDKAGPKKDAAASKLTIDLLAQLEASANTSQPGQLFWSPPAGDSSRARSVEITAYNVLTLLKHDKLPQALQAIKWLATQRNSVGGFVSTQDTMVAMQAMSEYSLRVSQSKGDLAVKATEQKGGKAVLSFGLNDDNRLLLQQQRVSALPNELSVEVAGDTGCFMVQTVLRYNVKESPEQRSFTLTAAMQKGDQALKVCAAYTGSKDRTGMVLVEVELLSGFAADEGSLMELENEVRAPVKKYEYDEKKGRVVLYLDAMPKSESCWTIGVVRKVKIDELKAAIVKVYDYYNEEDSFSAQYNLSSQKKKK